MCFKCKICLAIILISLCSCKKFVQIDPPITQLVTATVFDNDASATSAQIAIYAQMVNNTESYNLSKNNGLLSDELTNYSSNATQIQYYTNSLISTTSNGPWVNAYKYIYEANAIIENLQTISGVGKAVSQQLIGESKFVRAFWFFYLTNIYGDVPLVTTTDYQQNGNIARAPQQNVYGQIISDLTEAENLLSINYIDASDTTITNDRVRPNRSAAAALLARVYLYTKKYDSAEIKATNVINNPIYGLVNPLTSSDYGFTEGNSEAIWQLETPMPITSTSPNGATYDGQNYILLTTPTNVALSTEMLNSFEPGDQRRVIWVDSIITTTNPKKTFYFPYKYRTNSKNASANSPTEYVTALRLSEQYLIRAEARANQGNIVGAQADLNRIRNRANLPNTNAATQGDLIAAILHERQVELFTEWGNRWFDLIRLGAIDSVLGSPENICQLKGGIWSSYKQLYPIWLTEITVDASLTQNTGYQ